MVKNIGSLDRALRVVLGLALLIWAISGAPAAAWSWIGWLGVVPLGTALIGWCPLYTLLGVNTCRTA